MEKWPAYRANICQIGRTRREEEKEQKEQKDQKEQKEQEEKRRNEEKAEALKESSSRPDFRVGTLTWLKITLHQWHQCAKNHSTFEAYQGRSDRHTATMSLGRTSYWETLWSSRNGAFVEKSLRRLRISICELRTVLCLTTSCLNFWFSGTVPSCFSNIVQHFSIRISSATHVELSLRSTDQTWYVLGPAKSSFNQRGISEICLSLIDYSNPFESIWWYIWWYLMVYLMHFDASG